MTGRAKSLNHVSVGATNLDDSVRFYTEVLGLQVIPSPTFSFPVTWMRAGNLQVHLFERSEQAYRAPAFNHFGIEMDDFMAVYQRIKELDLHEPVAFFSAVYELPDGTVQMYVRDPAGNLVELDFPDSSTIDRSRVPEYRVLADDVEQAEASRGATLFLYLAREAQSRTPGGAA
jgi:catechol 2,3-dioxygenase-like lactoylglutathione lyase family enzyme